MHADIDFTPLTHPTDPPARTDPTANAVARLAQANGWQYYPHAVEQQLPGVVFREPNGRSRFSQRAVNIVRIPGTPMMEIGDSFYTEVAVGNQFTQRWGYLAVDVGVAMPSVTMESRSNFAQSPLPATPARALADESRSGLRVEAAPGAEFAADALLTPEVVEALNNGSYPLDVELNGRWLFLYAPRSLSTDDAQSWKHTLRTAQLLIDRVRESFPMDALSSGAEVHQFGAPVTPMQSRGGRVNRMRVTWYLLAVVAAMGVAGGAALLFGGR